MLHIIFGLFFLKLGCLKYLSLSKIGVTCAKLEAYNRGGRGGRFSPPPLPG